MTFKQGGGATVIDHTAKWNIAISIENAKYATNSTAGWKETEVGAKEFTVTVTILLHAGGQQPLQMGTSYAFEAHIDDGGSDYYSGTAKVVSYGDLEVDPMTGDPLQQEVTMEGHGALTANGTVVNV